jgi:hypothetical protein
MSESYTNYMTRQPGIEEAEYNYNSPFEDLIFKGKGGTIRLVVENSHAHNMHLNANELFENYKISGMEAACVNPDDPEELHKHNLMEQEKLLKSEEYNKVMEEARKMLRKGLKARQGVFNYYNPNPLGSRNEVSFTTEFESALAPVCRAIGKQRQPDHIHRK